MAKPEEFRIQIEPDGRVVLDGRGMELTSYRRIVELLEETVGPVQELDRAPDDPPQRHIHPAQSREQEESDRLDLGRDR